MAEQYLWQSVPNQGYNKYGQGVIGPGSKESLDKAVNFHAGDGKTITRIEVLAKDTVVPYRWGDFGTDYFLKSGDLKMTYGEEPVDYMAKRWQDLAKQQGVTKLLDEAGSINVALMESTHRDAKTGEYLLNKLRKPGTVVDAIKDANIGVAIPTPEMKYILSSEALKAGALPTELKPGMVIAQDALGVYSPPLKTLLKKNKPVDAAGQAVFDKLTKFGRIQDLATKYAKDGGLPAQSAEKAIQNAWKFVQKWATKIK